MNRRNALKNLGLISGGIILMPSCNFSDEKVSIILNKLKITVPDEKLLKEVVATILPEGDIPGAKSLKVHNFVWVMIDDMLSDKKQADFINGLHLFNDYIKESKKKPFIGLPEKERITVLKDLLNRNNSQNKMVSKDDMRNIKNFIKASKYYATLGYMQSEYIMTKIMPYQLVPGTYGTCETIDTNKRVNING